MSSHRYQVGTTVELLPRTFGPRDAKGTYTVIRLLPNDSTDREYRIQHVENGQERVARESEIRAGAAAGTAGA